MVSTIRAAPVLPMPDEARALCHKVQYKLRPLLKLPCPARPQDGGIQPLGGAGVGVAIAEAPQHHRLHLLPGLALRDSCSVPGLAVAGHPFR